MGKSPQDKDQVSQRSLLRWTLIGVLIRLLIMPFTMHTSDIFFIYYFPYQWAAHGVWDIYSFIQWKSPQFTGTYYGPVAYFVVGIFLSILRLFLPGLKETFGIFEQWFFSNHGGTVHYASLLSGSQLFRTLFFLKVPYLFFDFACGFLLMKIAKGSKRGILCYQLWMLNPLVLYSVYAIGQLEILPVFLTVAALYFADRSKPALSMVCLSLGGMVKVYPFLFIPVVILAVAKEFRQRVQLLGFSLLPLLIFLLPLAVVSKGAVMGSIWIAALENVTGGTLRKILFAAGYLFLMFSAHRHSHAHHPPAHLYRWMLLVMLLYAATGLIKFRYLTWLSPFLILGISRDKTVGWLLLGLIPLMAEVLLSGNQVQWGLFAPVYPEFFASIPIIDAWLSVSNVPLEIIHQISYRLSLLVIAFITYRVWKWQDSY